MNNKKMKNKKNQEDEEQEHEEEQEEKEPRRWWFGTRGTKKEEVKKKKKWQENFRQTVIASRLRTVYKWQNRKEDTNLKEWCQKKQFVSGRCING